MKKISLSIVAVLLTSASIMATTVPAKHAKKLKQAACTYCPSPKCPADCTPQSDCCKSMSCCKN